MNNFYIYRFDYRATNKTVSATVIFCDREDMNEDILRTEIKNFYEEQYQTDKVFVIGPNYLESKLHQVFIERLNSTFKGIPKRQETFLEEGLFIAVFDKTGKLTCDKTLPDDFVRNYLNEGVTKYFYKTRRFSNCRRSASFCFSFWKALW